MMSWIAGLAETGWHQSIPCRLSSKKSKAWSKKDSQAFHAGRTASYAKKRAKPRGGWKSKTCETNSLPVLHG